MMKFSQKFIRSLMVLVTVGGAATAGADESAGVLMSADLYASRSHFMPYSGHQSDVLGTVHLGYGGFAVKPFLRLSHTGYDFGGGVAFDDYSRSGIGLGADIFINTYLRVRLMTEAVTSTDSRRAYQQDYYGVIYNQYLDLNLIEFNNYLESFFIPRVADDKIDTFVRVQALKSFYLISDLRQSHALFPFVQYKAKYNDEANFGLSGYVASAGAGYKYFRLAGDHNVALVAEAHSVLGQSSDFNGDWFQAFVAVQYFYE